MSIIPQSPGILSDRMIRELCMPPQNILHFRSVVNPLYMGLKPQNTELVSFLTTAFEEEIVKTYRNGEMYIHGVFVGNNPINQADLENFRPMISPFEPGQVRTDEAGNKLISYGTSSYGYDIRCGREFKIFSNINSSIVDPKDMDSSAFVDFTGDVCIVPPNSFVLARTVEHFIIPDDIIGICLGKSTYARVGLAIGVTPLEPQWEGYLTLEFSNTTPLPVKLYANEGCGQITFIRGSETCITGYKDRNGKYMNQAAEPVASRV